MAEPKRRRAAKKPRAPARKDSVIGLMAVPSPPPRARKRKAATAAPKPASPPAPNGAVNPEAPAPAKPSAPRKGRVDLQKVEEMAESGLTLEQIVAELGMKKPPGASLRVRMEAAIKRGRAHGSAKLKRAHYKAALNGSVTYLKEMLARLEQGDDEDEDDEWIVEEVILHGPHGAEGSNPSEETHD